MKTQNHLERGRNRKILYFASSLIIILSYALIISGLTLVLGISLFRESPILIASAFFIFAIFLNPIRSWFQAYVDNKFFKVNPQSNKDIQRFVNHLSDAKSLPTISRILHDQIITMFNPDQVHIFLYDPISKSYLASTNGEKRGEENSSEIRFEAGSNLVKVLSQNLEPLDLNKSTQIHDSLQTDRPKIALLDTSVIIPMSTSKYLMGWIALGNQSKSVPYKKRDLDLLMQLGEQTALVVDRIQVSNDLTRRINEMNVLTRISQGVNITLALEDMLELIFSQLNQVIQMNVFQLILCDPENNSLSNVFYVDEDERIIDKENQIIEHNYGLDREVVKNQRPLITDDYDEECRRRGVIPALKNIYAWMGIPLNTGAETIGLISIGSREPLTNYSSEHINLLQSVADQTAGAMIKLKLLQEAERRTNQLRFLNEIIRNLSQTLEPSVLLKRVLESAIELVNCKHGNLYLIDTKTNELTLTEQSSTSEYPIEILITNFDEERWKVISTALPIILSQKINTEKNSQTISNLSGQVLINALIVPIRLKEIVIGVIEVYDRRDGLPFNKDDQELLSAFASQSAIAYENAQKYTFTDRSLAARLEELSVMQRIDRELNTSLDVARAMQITLAWAIRQSDVEAGIVGIVDDNLIRVMASHGYKETPPEEFTFDITQRLEQVIKSRQPQTQLLSEIEKNDPDSVTRIMEEAIAQFFIPIQREEEVIGIVLLESKSLITLPDETLDFLIRLSDHAAIAIANAQLFLEIKAANLAKSEFVSFVSHELKTPMTSIKGFADLLAAGAVGPINDVQNNFLSTIRSNVDRMANLVSDLSDVSRIEAGRIRLEFESIPINEVVSEIVRSSNNQLESKEQSLTIEIDEDIPPLWGDRIRLIQILTNLVSNANKYSPPNTQIKISAEQCQNIWDPSGSAQVIHISVEDKGYGISPQDQGKIFEKFFRADDPNIREVSGTGLGLNITKTLVEMQGGQIWFESKLNEGTTFHFTTPISESG